MTNTIANKFNEVLGYVQEKEIAHQVKESLLEDIIMKKQEEIDELKKEVETLKSVKIELIQLAGSLQDALKVEKEYVQILETLVEVLKEK